MRCKIFYFETSTYHFQEKLEQEINAFLAENPDIQISGIHMATGTDPERNVNYGMAVMLISGTASTRQRPAAPAAVPAQNVMAQVARPAVPAQNAAAQTVRPAVPPVVPGPSIPPAANGTGPSLGPVNGIEGNPNRFVPPSMPPKP